MDFHVKSSLLLMNECFVANLAASAVPNVGGKS